MPSTRSRSPVRKPRVHFWTVICTPRHWHDHSRTALSWSLPRLANGQLEPRCGSNDGSKLRLGGGTSSPRVRFRLVRFPRDTVDGVPNNRNFGIHPIACASIREPRFLHYPARGGMRGGSDTDDALEAIVLKAELKRR